MSWKPGKCLLNTVVCYLLFFAACCNCGCGVNVDYAARGLQNIKGIHTFPLPLNLMHASAFGCRIDKGTTGIMVFAKTNVAHTRLQRQFAAKTARREYWALLTGCPSKE